MMSQRLQISAYVFRSPTFRSVVNDAIAFFEQTPLSALPPSDRFFGTGVYAIYYRGSFRPYLPLSKVNERASVRPIYVGKAVPAGWRQGRNTKEKETTELYARLCQHARSISQTKNLKLNDFSCRFMLLRDIEGDLIVPVEAELIRKYRPVWNSVLDGFGNHDPGKGRYKQAVSEWDVLHPGRDWVKRLTGSKPRVAVVKAKVVKFVRRAMPPLAQQLPRRD
jgi:hypothetical protein